MYNQHKPRVIVPVAVAILLTFSRGGMLPFEGIYTTFDRLTSSFLLIIAPLFAIIGIFPRPLNKNFHLLFPIVMLAIWVLTCIFIGSPIQDWPPLTAFVTLGLSILICSQIAYFELQRVRHLVLLVTGIFNLYSILYARDTINLIFHSELDVRLGAEYSPANLVALPRILYVLIFTCGVSILIEHKTWIKWCAAVLMILPMLLAISTGGRGPLVAFIAAMLFFIYFLRTKRDSLVGGILLCLIVIAGYFAVNTLSPVLSNRLLEETGRIDIWKTALNIDNFSLFGSGFQADYPHNIFLEFLWFYGVVGLILFLIVLVISFKSGWRYYKRSNDLDALWVIGVLVLQMTAQQLSLNIFTGSFWAAIVLPLGFSWIVDPASKVTYKMNTNATQGATRRENQ